MPTLTSEVIGGMITPALLISASGTLVLSTSNRLGRVVDRVRALVGEVERAREAGLDAPGPERAAMILKQFERLSRRVILLRSSMTSLYLSIGCFIGTSLSVGLGVLMEWRYFVVPVCLALAGSCSLLYGSILLVREAHAGVVSTLEEMEYARRLFTSAPRDTG